MKKELIIYQAKSGAIELKGDYKNETIWANLQQISDLFETDKSGISRHIKNIYQTGELEKLSTVAKIATVQNEGNRKIKRQIEFYNLDVILSVGYRVNSKKATIFRQWATKTLRQHILTGYTVNKKLLSHNYEIFMRALDEVKRIMPATGKIGSSDTLELVKMFASTWLSIDAYDRKILPRVGANKKQVNITADQIGLAIGQLKKELTAQQKVGNLFGTKRGRGDIDGIIGNIFQSFRGTDLYPTLEEKAAHLLYFMVKNHPFVDGNKRIGAFSFIWFLNQAKLLDTNKLSPEALTTLTLLVAESNPIDKERMTGLILLLLKS